jgi:hypothetical protein
MPRARYGFRSATRRFVGPFARLLGHVVPEARYPPPLIYTYVQY